MAARPPSPGRQGPGSGDAAGNIRSEQQQPPSLSLARFPTKFRFRHMRTRTGCLGCRGRKKKCDEARPSCTACVQRNTSPLRTAAVQQRSTDAAAGASVQRARGSPPPRSLSFASPNGAVFLTPESGMLLRYYTTETVLTRSLAGVQSTRLFLDCVIPSAYNDDILMHAVLAMGGAQLAYVLNSPEKIDVAKRMHYLHVIWALQTEIDPKSLEQPGKIERLLLVLVLLTHFELLSGSQSDGIAYHVSALRSLFTKLQSKRSARTNNHPHVVVARESFSFLILVNRLFPGCELDNSLLKQYVSRESLPTTCEHLVGPMFGSFRKLFELMLDAERLYRERRVQPSMARKTAIKYQDLQRRTKEWSMSTPEEGLTSSEQDGEHTNYSRAAECIRRGLYIHALASSSGASFPSDNYLQTIDVHATAVIEQSKLIAHLPHMAFVLWALLTAGSCLRHHHERYRSELLAQLAIAKVRGRHRAFCRQILELLWADPDPTLYGPHGVYLVIAKYGLRVSDF